MSELSLAEVNNVYFDVLKGSGKLETRVKCDYGNFHDVESQDRYERSKVELLTFQELGSAIWVRKMNDHRDSEVQGDIDGSMMFC